MAIKNRQKHLARRLDFKADNQEIMPIPRDNLIRRIMLDFEVYLATGATAGSAAKEDDLLNLIKRIEVRQNGADHLFDVDLRTYAKALIFEYGAEITRDEIAIPTANDESETAMHIRVPIDFAINRNVLSDYRALVPAPVLDSLELLVTWGDIDDVLGTVGNTTVSDKTKCNVSIVEVYGTAAADQEQIQEFVANRVDIREGVEQIDVTKAHSSYPAEALPLEVKPEPARHLAHLLVGIEDSGGDRKFVNDVIDQLALDNVKGAGESILYEYWADMHGQQKLDYGLEADNPTGCLYIDWADQRNGGLDNVGVDALKWRFLTNAPASSETDAVRIYKKYVPLKRA